MSQNDGFDPSDPFTMWRNLRDANLDAWAKGMNTLVNSEAFSKALGAQLDSTLMASAPFKQAVDQYMDAYLAQLHMPSRVEVISLAKRMTNLEMRLDDLDARLDHVLAFIEGQAQPAPSAPTTERKLDQLEAKLDHLLSAFNQITTALTVSEAEAHAETQDTDKPTNGRSTSRSRRARATNEEPTE